MAVVSRATRRTYPELESPRLLVVVLRNEPLLGLVLERLEVGRGERKELVYQQMQGGEDEVGGEDCVSSGTKEIDSLSWWSWARMGRMSLNRSMPRRRKRLG